MNFLMILENNSITTFRPALVILRNKYEKLQKSICRKNLFFSVPIMKKNQLKKYQFMFPIYRTSIKWSSDEFEDMSKNNTSTPTPNIEKKYIGGNLC